MPIITKRAFVNVQSASIFPKFDTCLKTSVNLPVGVKHKFQADTVPSSTGECTSSDMSWQNLLGCKQRLAKFL
ncbi:hypothetical protein L208DRAFT_1396900 [Tricholoma matsutake]|nr:hypothetical protein L208DRAFT_1412767 [Tricholoma matsutake 945]KAF8232698.1 hypothetical protein L208DRAFT_1396900 [Tricholoma matsutake 945]